MATSPWAVVHPRHHRNIVATSDCRVFPCNIITFIPIRLQFITCLSNSKASGSFYPQSQANSELSGGASGLRVNGVPHAIQDAESRDPSSFTMPKQMLEDAIQSMD
ncbi:hypothetical protein FRC02_011903 [Tulasnella sp. 418]|nr:hypothetical protein FRC02_011903 [Tulasnella sp. 418]